MTWYAWDDGDLILKLHIKPRATRNAFMAPYGVDTYKVAISSPAVDGKANEELLRFLSREFGLPRSRIDMESGLKSRTKSLRLKSPTRLPLVLGEEISLQRRQEA